MQLHAIGFSRSGIRHALRSGRFFLVRRGVVAVGTTTVGVFSRLKAVTLAFPRASVSNSSSAVLWEMLSGDAREIHIAVPAGHHPRAPDLTVHRRNPMPAITTRRGIPTTRPLQTLIDLAATHPDVVEEAVNEADMRGLIRIYRALREVEQMPAMPGTRRLLSVLEAHTVTDSKLERRFLRIVHDLGLPMPQTQTIVNGFRVDFFWPELGLVVETDGLTYHRTPAQQAKDRVRDQVHTAAGLTPLRFTNAQIVRDATSVGATLSTVAKRLGASVRKRSL